jgi:hypothetical protein
LYAIKYDFSIKTLKSHLTQQWGGLRRIPPQLLTKSLNKKPHRVAHENQRRGGFCYYHYTTFIATVKIPFSKKNTSSHYFLQYIPFYTKCNRYVLHCQLSINQFVQHNFLCTIMDTAHSLNPFTLIIRFHFLSYRLSFLHLTDDGL